jgi:hypothetical protein
MGDVDGMIVIQGRGKSSDWAIINTVEELRGGGIHGGKFRDLL